MLAGAWVFGNSDPDHPPHQPCTGHCPFLSLLLAGGCSFWWIQSWSHHIFTVRNIWDIQYLQKVFTEELVWNQPRMEGTGEALSSFSQTPAPPQPTTQSQSPGPFDHESDNLLMFHVSLFNFLMDEIPPGQHHVLEIVCSPLHLHFRNSVLGTKAIEILFSWRSGGVEGVMNRSLGLMVRVLCAKLPQSCLTLWDPMDCSPPGSPVHGDSPGKNAGVSCYFLLQGIFLTQGLNPGLPYCRQFLSCLSHQGSS